MNTENTENLPEVKQSALVEVERSRAVQEVQASLVIAQKFPRDLTSVISKITESCKRFTLAEKAFYKYPKGGTMVTGPSIRLAEVIAQNYKNLDFGIRELERRDGSSLAESYCWDLENNVKQTKIFEVAHIIDTKKGPKRLTDQRDIYELVANQGARRLRACILGIIPGDIVDAGVKQCHATIAKGGGEPLIDRIRKMVMAFKELGISQEMIEEKLEHKIDLTTGEEIAELTGIFQSVKDKMAKRSDFFNFPKEQEENEGKAAKLKEKLGDANVA